MSMEAQLSENLMMARNMLTQKCTGFVGTATTLLDTKDMVDGQKAGLLTIGDKFYGIGVTKGNGKLYIYMEYRNDVTLL